jgi:hypothetical protein
MQCVLAHDAFRESLKQPNAEVGAGVGAALSLLAGGQSIVGRIATGETWGMADLQRAFLSDSEGRVAPAELRSGSQESASVCADWVLSSLPEELRSRWCTMKLNAAGSNHDDAVFVHQLGRFRGDVGEDMYASSERAATTIATCVCEGALELSDGFAVCFAARVQLGGRKDPHEVHVPKRLSMGGTYKYKLSAAIIHRSNASIQTQRGCLESSDGGHYTALVQWYGRWSLCDDGVSYHNRNSNLH